MILFLSTRRNGRSLGDMVREEMGRIPGTIALFGCFLIMIIILAVLALIVVKALAESPWGMFTVMATIPIAMFMGVYMRYIRPGRIGEISIIGVVLLLLSIWLGARWRPIRSGARRSPSPACRSPDAGRLWLRGCRAAGMAGAGAA